MKNKILILLVCFCCQIILAQTSSIKDLNGQVYSDSLKIDAGQVINLNSKLKTEINSKGFFTIPVKINDTILFLGLEFESKKVVISKKEFEDKLLKVKLTASIYKLNTITINSKNTIKPNIGNTQKIVDQQYFDDEKSSPQNPIPQPSGAFENQADFVRMYKDMRKVIRNMKKPTEDETYQYTFIELVLNEYNDSFFTESLGINEDDISLFLIYCDNDPNSKKFLKSHTRFELANFLVAKSNEFKSFTTVDK